MATLLNRAARPSTAPANKERKPFDVRPLGRAPMPHKLQAEVRGGSAVAVIAGLKSECLMLQRRIDELRHEDAGVEMALLEQTLVGIQAVDVGDRIEAAKSTLLELIVQKVQELSRAMLQACEVDSPAAAGPGRTAAFTALVDHVASIMERKALWEQRIERAHAATLNAKSVNSAGTQSDGAAFHGATIDTLDLALNEPTVAEVRKLIEEQRRLNAMMREHFSAASRQQPGAVTPPVQGLTAAAAAAPGAAKGNGSATTNSGPSSSSAGQDTNGAKKKGAVTAPAADPAHSEQLAAQLRELHEANSAYRKRIVDLELEVHRLSEAAMESTDDERDVTRKLSALALTPATRTALLGFGVDTTNFSAVNEADAVVIGQRFAAWVADAAAAHNDTKAQRGQQKREGNSGYEGVLLAYLNKQNKILAELMERHSAALKGAAEQQAASQAEVERQRRVVQSLEQRVESLKAAAARAAIRHETALQDAAREAAKFRKLYEDQQQPSTDAKRVVNVKNQSATPAERERALQQELGYSQQCVKDLTEQLQVLKAQVEREQAGAAVVQRERQSFIQRLADETTTAKRAVAEMHAKADELVALKDQVAALRRELREKASIEADTQQRAWRLEVELHIAQNVVGELRQREDTLTKAAIDSRECQDQLRRELEAQRDLVAKLRTEMAQHVREADTDRVVAQEVLASERSKMIENEKEVERLRSLDMQMEVLEQNFTNYAASKLAQREANEEEERALVTCMETVQRDVFTLPAGADSEDQLQMLLKQLEAQKVVFDNEERIRRRNKATSVNFKDERSGKKQLTQLLRMRYNAIQIFAVQQRLRQLQLERELRNLRIENTEIKRRHDVAANELAQARLQCDSLVQRTTELDLERKQLVRTRTASDLEIKNLKAAIQRMRVSSEEQEKILVEVGTRLQCLKLQEPGAGVAKPLETVVIGADP